LFGFEPQGYGFESLSAWAGTANRATATRRVEESMPGWVGADFITGAGAVLLLGLVLLAAEY